jgi:hypothetical protein
MKTKEWLKTLAVTAIGAAAGAVGTVATLGEINWAGVLAAGAVALFAFLAKSPLPEFD